LCEGSVLWSLRTAEMAHSTEETHTFVPAATPSRQATCPALDCPAVWMLFPETKRWRGMTAVTGAPMSLLVSP
ncbi:unnamed protein product, partial [Tetraodon nigroviridis]